MKCSNDLNINSLEQLNSGIQIALPML